MSYRNVLTFIIASSFSIHLTHTAANIAVSPSSSVNVPKSSGEVNWITEALRDIAYFLRSHKFNDFDRRYETDPNKAQRTYFKEFPRPPLRSLHWEVNKHCEDTLVHCVTYLMKKIRHVVSRRSDDTSVVMQEQKWTFEKNAAQINQTDADCNKLRLEDDTLTEPFEGPLERFQWRVTASYYMCLFTMKETPALKRLNDVCDNFANCLNDQKPNNKDPRANDGLSFHCAQYSFCPDPCCPLKIIGSMEECWNSQENPCYIGNPIGKRECFRDRSLNLDFSDMILNRWNVTCVCSRAGFEWNSLYGMCIDVDECTTGTHNCDQELEACVNLEGSFRCACKWGHIWKEQEKRCLPSAALKLIKLGHKARSNKTENVSFVTKIRRLFSKSSSNRFFISTRKVFVREAANLEESNSGMLRPYIKNIFFFNFFASMWISTVKCK